MSESWIKITNLNLCWFFSYENLPAPEMELFVVEYSPTPELELPAVE